VEEGKAEASPLFFLRFLYIPGSHPHQQVPLLSQQMKKSQPESTGAGKQKRGQSEPGQTLLADAAGGAEMAMRAAQSANKAKSLYLSFFCMMFSFIVINVSR